MTQTVTQREVACEDQLLQTAQDVVVRLLAYCQANDWAGYDPYDALNSKWFTSLPFLNFKFARLVLTQVLKRSPVNFRPLLRIPPTQNPKGLAVILTALLKLRKLALLPDYTLARAVVAQIIALRSPDSQYWSWGYSFPWQTRTIMVPRGAPNLVCTVFVANSLLDTFETLGDTQYLEMAISAGDYLLEELYYTEADGVEGFSYPSPSSKAKVHNANFLAAALLSRLHRHTRRGRFVGPAMGAARYSASKQQDDGSWYYGELATQRWIDNFHTGYNLCALRRIADYTKTAEFDQNISRGYQFYLGHFFREDGAPRYFHNRTYPIDTHCVAQSVITLLDFSGQYVDATQRARDVISWSLDNLWNPRGYFYCQECKWGKIAISYMRWSQAWMLLALASFLENLKHEANHAC